MLCQSACVVSPKGLLEDSTKHKFSSNVKKRVAVVFSSHFISGLGEEFYTVSGSDIKDISNSTNCLSFMRPPGYLKRMVCETIKFLKESGKFASVDIVAPTVHISEYDFVLKIKYSIEEESSFWQKVWSWTNLLTITVIPYRGERNYKLQVEVVNSSGKTKNEYYLEDGYIAWRQLLLLPAAPFVDGYYQNGRYIHKNFVNSLILNMEKDALL